MSGIVKVPWEEFVVALVDIEGPSEDLLVEATFEVALAGECIEEYCRLEVVLRILGYPFKVGAVCQDCKLASMLGSYFHYPHQMDLRDLFYQDNCLKPFSCHMMVRIEYFSLLQAVSSYRRHVHHLV